MCHSAKSDETGIAEHILIVKETPVQPYYLTNSFWSMEHGQKFDMFAYPYSLSFCNVWNSWFKMGNIIVLTHRFVWSTLRLNLLRLYPKEDLENLPKYDDFATIIYKPLSEDVTGSHILLSEMFSLSSQLQFFDRQTMRHNYKDYSHTCVSWVLVEES